MTRAKVNRRGRPSVSTRPIGPDQVEVHTHCRHGGFRVGFQLGETVTARVAVCMALAHHALAEGCACMGQLWPRYRTPQAPADLVGMVRRYTALWSEIEREQRRQGYAVVDWAAAYEQVMGGAA